MKREKAYLIGTSHHSFRQGIPAEIIGVEMISHKGFPANLCFRVEYSDKVKDWTRVDDKDHYKIITFNDILNSAGQ